MTRLRMAVLVTLVLGVATSVLVADNLRDLRAHLTGYQEVPTLSSSGSAQFDARINNEETAVEWQLSYANTESAVTQAHIHFQAPALNGAIIVFLCTNLNNGPAGTQLCPAAPATISGTFGAADVLGNAASSGLEAGNLEEFIAAMRAGATYANVHTVVRGGGEVRGQIIAHDNRHGDH